MEVGLDDLYRSHFFARTFEVIAQERERIARQPDAEEGLDELDREFGPRAVDLILLGVELWSKDATIKFQDRLLECIGLEIEELLNMVIELLKKSRISEKTIRKYAELCRRRRENPKRWSLKALNNEYYEGKDQRNVTLILENEKRWIALEKALDRHNESAT